MYKGYIDISQTPDTHVKLFYRIVSYRTKGVFTVFTVFTTVYKQFR